MPVKIDKETIYETFRIDPLKAEKAMEQIKALVHEGNVRRIIVKDADGFTLIEAPLTVGVVGAALLPVWAAIGAVVAVVANCTISVEKKV